MASIEACRSCGEAGLEPVLDLGRTPLADRLLSGSQLTEPEPTYPLVLTFCAHCSLVQILETVSPEILFDADYPYFSSFSDALLRHSQENVRELIGRHGLGAESLVVEIASNDGYLLKNYLQAGIPVLGIDPVPGPVGEARKIGVPTLQEFFNASLAEQLAQQWRFADIVHANNVLAHVADTNDFVRGIATLLKPHGTAVIEVPYVKDLVDKCEFDTIYHEHLCYFSVTALDNLFRRHGLFLNEVRRLTIHGGSLRLYLGKSENVGESVESMLALESREGVDRLNYYLGFARRVEMVKRELLALLHSLRDQNKQIAAYGAAAKGSTLINYVGIGKDLVEFVVDRNTFKQGRYMPGRHLPIYDPGRLTEVMPDYVLLLAWNFAEEIMQQQWEYSSRGGSYILPLPEPGILERSAQVVSHP